MRFQKPEWAQDFVDFVNAEGRFEDKGDAFQDLFGDVEIFNPSTKEAGLNLVAALASYDQKPAV